MTIENLKDNKQQIIARFYELGGIESMLVEFMITLKQAVEFGLNNTDDYLELVMQFFTERYTGKKVKTSIADVLSSYKERNNLF